MRSSDASIELVEYDPTWSEKFQHERGVLTEALAPWLAGEIEHIGSTAVPGLVAKPVIDIMAPVQSLSVSTPAINVLGALGYVYFPYKADTMHWFCKPSPAHRTHHLHLVPMDSALWRQRLAFRDALRTDSDVFARYAQLKRGLASAYRLDREAYTDAKAPFIHGVLASLGQT